MTALKDIEGFLAKKRIAVVGVSRNPKDFSHLLFREFTKCGYDAIAVNPNPGDFDGRPSFKDIKDVTPAPEAALLMTPRRIADDILIDCGKAGIRHLWIYGTGTQPRPSAPVSELREAGFSVIDGECPFMFLKNSGGIHAVHRWLRKLFRSYPK